MEEQAASEKREWTMTYSQNLIFSVSQKRMARIGTIIQNTALHFKKPLISLWITEK
jgi:hypothetical protein